MGGPGGRAFAVCAVAVVWSAAAAAVTVEPPSVLLPNFDRVMIGSQGGLEGGALLCRAKAAEATWYNPANIVRGRSKDINANASLYELVSADFEAADAEASTSELVTLPAFVGAASRISDLDGEHGKLAWGFCIAQPVSWTSNTSSYNHLTGQDTPTDENIITTSSASSVVTVATGASFSFATSPRFSMGVGGFLYQTTVNLKKTKFDDWWDGTGDSWTWSSDRLVNITASHLGFSLGLFYERNSNANMALVVRTPGIKISGVGTLDDHLLVVMDEPGGVPPGPWSSWEYYQRDAHEEEVEVDWQIPLEVSGGFAFKWGGGKQQLEFDVNYHAGTYTYDVFPAGYYDVRMGNITDASGAGLYVHDPQVPRAAFTTTGKDVINMAIGYRYELSETKSLHAGFRTAFSQVEGGVKENLFAPIDLSILTVGYSSATESTFSSFGLVLGFGGTESFKVIDLYDYQPVEGSLNVSTVGLVVGAGFKIN